RSYSAIAASSDPAKGRTDLETRALLRTTRPRDDLPQPERRFICEPAPLPAKPHPCRRDVVRGVRNKHARLFPGDLRRERHLFARAIELPGRFGFSVRPP